MHLRETASRAATLLAKRPGLFGRVVLAKINTVRRLPPLPVQRQINGVVFEYELNNYHGTAPMYYGSYALLVIEVMKRLLHPGDVFLDVGANIGYLSAVAAGLVGKIRPGALLRTRPSLFLPVAAFSRAESGI